MRTRWWVTTILVLTIIFTLVAAYTAFAATAPKAVSRAAACGNRQGKGQMMESLTPAQRTQMEALREQMMSKVTPEQRTQMEALREQMMGTLTTAQRAQMEAQCDKVRGNNGGVAAPATGAGAGAGNDISL